MAVTFTAERDGTPVTKAEMYLMDAKLRESNLYKAISEQGLGALFAPATTPFRTKWQREAALEEAVYVDKLFERGDSEGMFGEMFARRAAMAEAHTTSMFPYLMGAEIRRTLMAAYDAVPKVYQEFCQVGAFADFRKHYGIRLSAVGEPGELAEGEEYNELTATEERWNLVPRKWGGIIAWTMEAAVNDDLNGIQQLMGSAGMRLGQRPDKLGTAILTGNAATTYDSVTLLHASSHGANLVASTALSEAAVDAGVIAMAKQTGRDGELLGVSPSILMTTADLIPTAQRILLSSVNIVTALGSTSAAALQGALNTASLHGIRPLKNPYIAGESGGATTDWFLLATPATYPAVRLMHYGGLEPQVFREATGSQAQFDRDLEPRFKVRLVAAAVGIDHVGVYGRT